MCEVNHIPCEYETRHEEAHDEDQVHETLEDDAQGKEAYVEDDFVQDVQEDEVLEDKEHHDEVSYCPPSSEDVNEDIGINEGNDEICYLLYDEDVPHDDYWGSFAFPIYDSSRSLVWFLRLWRHLIWRLFSAISFNYLLMKKVHIWGFKRRICMRF